MGNDFYALIQKLPDYNFRLSILTSNPTHIEAANLFRMRVSHSKLITHLLSIRFLCLFKKGNEELT